jgi:hypothetical protein
MRTIPLTKNALIIRTDFSSQTAWESLVAAVREPSEPFICNMEFLEDQENAGATLDQLTTAIPDDYPHSFIVVADATAISQPDHPLLVVDLLDEPGRKFRALATEIPAIENNLSVANMSFEEFADQVDETGIFRGFPEM